MLRKDPETRRTLLKDLGLTIELGYGKRDSRLVSAIPIAATAAAAPALPATTPATAALLGAIAALAVNGTIPAGLKGHCRCLATAGTNNRRPGAAARAVPAACIVMPRRCGSLFCLSARLATARRRVATLLEKLLFACGKNKLLPAVTARK